MTFFYVTPIIRKVFYNELKYDFIHYSKVLNILYVNVLQNRVLTLWVYQVYMFRYQNRVNSEVNSVFGKIGRFDEFDRVNTR